MAYNVYQGDELIAEGIEDKEYAVEGLTPNTDYSFSISEVIGKQESEKSDPVTVTTKHSDVESVVVSPKTNNLEVGRTRTLRATVTPDTAKQDVTWSSDNDEVATVDNGTVTAVGEGTATITATAEGKTDTSTVNVTESESGPEE
ncbi:Ig domain-containing protein [Virgibacillus halophilus]|uniref:Ig-like domain-containing protein n=1 Tax=Tigheibacillus halophilus TaxID=361280 RepID=A0ABU5CBR9_9BACI|nr:Ig-like domain-containing protein [Virgibacillus halophilus]